MMMVMTMMVMVKIMVVMMDCTDEDSDAAQSIVVDRPTQLICISDIYLLSWRW